MRFAILPIGSDRVNLAFSHGASLADPRGLLDGTGKSIRHLKLQTAHELESPAVAS